MPPAPHPQSLNEARRRRPESATLQAGSAGLGASIAIENLVA